MRSCVCASTKKKLKFKTKTTNLRREEEGIVSSVVKRYHVFISGHFFFIQSAMLLFTKLFIVERRNSRETLVTVPNESYTFNECETIVFLNYLE